MQGALKPHVSLNVSDIDAAVAFYEKVFGTTATKRRPGYAKFDLQVPALNLTMQEAPRTGVNASHFGIQVESTADVEAAKAAFESAGLKTFAEEQTACCYALQDKVWVEDPDGNAWEVFVVLGEAGEMGGRARDEGSACCAPALGPAPSKEETPESAATACCDATSAKATHCCA